MDSRLLFHKGASLKIKHGGEIEEISKSYITADSLFALGFGSHLAGCLQEMCCLVRWHAAFWAPFMYGAGSVLAPARHCFLHIFVSLTPVSRKPVDPLTLS